MRIMPGSKMHRVATNVTVRQDLGKEAKRLGINISELLNRALEAEIRLRQAQQWLSENEAAIDSYNARVAERGVFSDDWRKF
jgi:antitoxin CcdA